MTAKSAPKASRHVQNPERWKADYKWLVAACAVVVSVGLIARFTYFNSSAEQARANKRLIEADYQTVKLPAYLQLESSHYEVVQGLADHSLGMSGLDPVYTYEYTVTGGGRPLKDVEAALVHSFRSAGLNAQVPEMREGYKSISTYFGNASAPDKYVSVSVYYNDQWKDMSAGHTPAPLTNDSIVTKVTVKANGPSGRD